MASKINYNNKAPFQTLEEIPDENKVNASDMNEIKQVVNTNADELNTAKEDIENLESGQGTASADITSLKNRVSTLETDNSTNKTNISNLEENKVDKVKGKGLSTEDFTTELKSKLENLENYDDTEIKEDISNLEAEQTEQNEQIDILLNALPTETQEAENINIKGTIPVKFKEFKLSGNSKQETTDTMPSPEFPSPIQNVEGDVNVTVANKEKTEQQTVTFPLSEGQKLYKGDYLADDGIHHVRKQIELDGTELVKIEQQNDNFVRAYTNKYNDMKNYEENDNYTPASNFICSHFESVSNYSLVKICVALNDQRIYITISKDIASTISEFKSYLAEQKQAGTPVILECELAEEEIEPYTPEQQEAHNQIKELTAYEEETNIYSTNEVGPIFKVTAVKDVNSVIEDTNAKIEAINELLSTTATSAMLLDNMQSDLESEVM